MKKSPNKTGLRVKGVAASPGISIGRAHVMEEFEVIASGVLLKDDEIFAEIEKFDVAVRVSVDEVEATKNNPALKEEEIEILEAHIEFLTDPQIKTEVIAKISQHKKNVTDSVIEVIQAAVQVFKNMEGEYMRARASDVQDIGNRILKNLNHSPPSSFQKLELNTIIVADDISPSDAIAMNMNQVVGFATRVGGKTSHTAILAK